MQFMHDWILRTAAEAGLTARTHEQLAGVTIDILPSKSHKDPVLQVYLPYYNRPGLIFLRKMASGHNNPFPKIIEINWYGIGLVIEQGVMVMRTYSQKSDPLFGRAPTHKFQVTVSRDGCIGTGNVPEFCNHKTIKVDELEAIIPSNERPTALARVFVSGSLWNESSRQHRSAVVQSIAGTFPRFVPVSLNDTNEFNPDKAMEAISDCSAFILIVQDFLSPWVSNEYQSARLKDKHILVLVNEESQYFSEIVEDLNRMGVPFYVKYSKDTLGGIVERWLNDLTVKAESSSIDEEYRKDDTVVPELVMVGSKTHKWIRIALAQIDYSVDAKKPFALRLPRQVKEKVNAVLAMAIQEKADLVVFPELCASPEISQAVDEFAERQRVQIVCEGSYYQKHLNASRLLMGGEEFLIKKRHPSKFEDSPLVGARNENNNPIRVFSTAWGNLCILICDDFRHDSNKVAAMTDLLIVQSLNPKPEKFRYRASVLVEDHHNYVLIVNAAQFGGTAIYGVIDRRYLDDLTQAKLRDISGPDSELAWVSPAEEVVLFADLSLVRRSVTQPTPLADEYANVRNVRKVVVKMDAGHS